MGAQKIMERCSLLMGRVMLLGDGVLKRGTRNGNEARMEGFMLWLKIHGVAWGWMLVFVFVCMFLCLEW